jgi:hypothetical protein
MSEDEEDCGMLVLCGVFMEHSEKLLEVSRDLNEILFEEAWRIAMRTRHY